MPSKKPQNKDTSVRVAIIGAIVTITTTLIYALIAPIVLEKIRATPNPTLTSSSTNNPLLALATSTLQEPATPPNLVYSNDFSDGSGGWQTGQTVDETRVMNQAVVDGSYQWEITHHGSFLSYLYPSDIPVLSNFEVSLDGKITGAEIDENSSLGLVFRSNENKCYLFSIHPIQSVYFVEEVENMYDESASFDSLTGYRKSSDAIHQDGFNSMKVIANGENLTFFINDVLVADITDNRLKSGAIGLAVYGSEETLTRFIIDNFQVTQSP